MWLAMPVETETLAHAALAERERVVRLLHTQAPHLRARGLLDVKRLKHEVDVRQRRGAIERVRSG